MPKWVNIWLMSGCREEKNTQEGDSRGPIIRRQSYGTRDLEQPVITLQSYDCQSLASSGVGMPPFEETSPNGATEDLSPAYQTLLATQIPPFG